jgi:hypothetical protein
MKFLKFLFYLTDVGPENGPHTYVSGSHKRKPAALLKDGRISDEEILRQYAKEQVVEITGPRGMIIAEDTRGLHKGKAPLSGDRLMLQIEFANSLFGTTYEEIELNDKFTEEFRQFAGDHPRTFVRYSG